MAKSANNMSLRCEGISIWDAARIGNLAVLRAAIGEGRDLNELELTTGFAPIHIASQTEQIEVIGLLLQNGADINIRSGNGSESAMHIAAKHGKLTSLEYLITKSAMIETLNSRGETPLHVAASSGRVEILEKLIESNANIEAITAEEFGGLTPLLLAITSQHQTQNKKQQEDWIFENDSCVSLLIDKEANIGAKSVRGESVIHCAIDLVLHSATKRIGVEIIDTI